MTISYKSKVIFFLLLAVSLFVAGCGSDGVSARENFRVGNQALEMRFLRPGAEDFFAGEQLTILVEFFNRGTADITNGRFFVTGYDLSYIRLGLDPAFITIDGKSEFDPRGDFSQILTIQSTAPVRMPENTEEFRQSVKLTACFEYTTFATAEICVDPDPFGRRVINRICNMAPVSPGPQGAPIVITRVEPRVSGNDFRLTIDFANQGRGVAYDRRISHEKCLVDLDAFQDLNKVDLIRVDFSGRTMDCQPRNPLRMTDGRGRIVCDCVGCINEYVDAYRTQVSIELKYGYRQEILKPIRILRG